MKNKVTSNPGESFELVLQRVEVLRLVVGIGNVGRYLPDVPDPADPEVAAEGAEVDDGLIVALQVPVMSTQEAPEKPPNVGPELGLLVDTFLRIALIIIFTVFYDPVFITLYHTGLHHIFTTR